MHINKGKMSKKITVFFYLYKNQGRCLKHKEMVTKIMQQLKAETSSQSRAAFKV